MVARRGPKAKRSVLIKFQPWLTAGAILLNFAATLSAAVSAYYSSKQSELATEAVNRQSKNEAFSEFLSAKEALCAVSLTQWDQMDGLDYSGPDVPNPEPAGAVILAVDYEAIMEDSSRERTLAYLRAANEKTQILTTKFTQLKIWLTEEEFDVFFDFVPWPDGYTYREEYILNAGEPAELFAVATQFRCRREMERALQVFKQLPEDSLWGQGAAVVVPISSKFSVNQIVGSWGKNIEYDYILEVLKRARIELDEPLSKSP